MTKSYGHLVIIKGYRALFSVLSNFLLPSSSKKQFEHFRSRLVAKTKLSPLECICAVCVNLCVSETAKD